MVISDLKKINIELSNMIKVEEVLANKSKSFDFFRSVFDRVSTLYVRGIEEKNETISAKQIAENWFKEKSINEMNLAIENFRDQIILNIPKPEDFGVITDNSFPLNDSTVLMLNYFAVSTILKSYQSCIQNEIQDQDMGEKNEILVIEDSRNYLVEVLEHLSMLEDIVSHHVGGEAVRYFVEKTINEARSPRSKGGKIRAENYKAKMNPFFEEVYDLFINPPSDIKNGWKSRAQCARYYVKHFPKRHPDFDIDFDIDKLVSEISTRINERYTSKKVN